MNARSWCAQTMVAVALAVSWMGTAHAITSRVLFTPTGFVPNDRLGYSVASAGDVNGDGFADVIVGAYASDFGGIDAGTAYVYYGGPTADAVADLTFIGAAAGDAFGVTVASAGDFNGDGFADLIVGAYNNDAGGTDAGRAYVYFGGPAADGTADLVLTGSAATDQFGNSVASAGDVNGDGFADVIVGALANDAGGSNAGRAYVYHGGPVADGTADLVLTGAAAGDLFGYSVASAGDVNGDGFADLIVGAYANDAGGADAGRAYLYYGGPAADANPDLTLTGAAANDYFGVSVSGAGDINSDGYADLIVGAPLNDAGGSSAGRANVYYGGPGADPVADLVLTGAAEDQLGNFVAAAGDVNGDGNADFIVGVPGASERAYAYFGGPGADATADITLTGAPGYERLGISVAGAGDVDGDGYDDLIVGGDLSDVGGTDTGRAYVYSIFPYQIISPNGGEKWYAGHPTTLRWRGRDRADIALSTDGGQTWNGLVTGVGGLEQNSYTLIAPALLTQDARVRLTYGGQNAKHSTSDVSDGAFRIVEATDPPATASRLLRSFTGTTISEGLGTVVAPAGDVNGDGYDDVIVGALYNDLGGADAGAAFVYFGGPGADAVADLTLVGQAPGDYFGGAVASAGDANGDGYADIIVGAYYNDAGGADAGRAYLYLGGATPDAVPDLIFTGFVGDQLGHSVGTAGDVNKDGFSDYFAAYVPPTGSGRVYVHLGGPSGGDGTFDFEIYLPGGTPGDQFGHSVSGGGDFDGDGISDLIIGAYNDIHGPVIGGRVYIYSGRQSFSGGLPILVLTAEAAGDYFGISVGMAGDVNGDGHADVIVGAIGNDVRGNFAGRAYVYFGGPVPDATPDLTLTGAAAEDEFGWSVAGAGDVNADGFADVIVGGFLNDAGGFNAGRAYVYFGGPFPDATADLVLTGQAASDQLGTSVSAAGDVNGDGFADILIGAPNSSAGAPAAGRANIYECNRYYVTSPNGGETWNVGATRSISWLGAAPADLWLSVDGGASYELLQSGAGGAESNSVPVRVPHLPTRFARVKITPHDAGSSGEDRSDSLFTIQTSVALLSLVAGPPTGEGVMLSWNTDPGVGPGGCAGFRLYRARASAEVAEERIGPTLITENRYLDPAGAPGMQYRLAAVDDHGEEVELGHVSVASMAGLSAWPSPIRVGSRLTITFAPPMVDAEHAATDLEVGLYDVRGRRIATMARGPIEPRAGVASVSWALREGEVAPGIYFVRAIAPSARFRAERKVVAIR